MNQENELGRFIRSCRETLRFSCQRVEELSLGKRHFERISPANLVDIEHGRHVPSFGKLLTLAEILDVPLHNFEERFRLDREDNGPLPACASYEVLTAEGKMWMERGEYAKALPCLKNARRLADDHPARRYEMDIAVANCRRHMGLLRVARDDFEKILAAKDINTRQRIKATAYLAEIFTTTDNAYMARLLLKEAIGLAVRKKEDDMVPVLREYLGTLYYWGGRYTQAVAEFRKAHAEHKKKKNKPKTASTLANIALCYMQKGDLHEAEQLLVFGRQLAREAGCFRTLARVQCHMAELNFLRQDLGKARQFALEACSLARGREYHDVMCEASYFLWEIARMNRNDAEERRFAAVIRKHAKKLERRLPTIQPFFDRIEQDRLAQGEPRNGRETVQ